MLRFLLKKGAEINEKGTRGDRALLYAADREDKRLVQLLLNNGAEINEEDSYGQTALPSAANLKTETMMQVLLEKKFKKLTSTILLDARCCLLQANWTQDSGAVVVEEWSRSQV